MDTRNPLFRGLKALTGPFDPFDITALPDRPGSLFLAWMEIALGKQVPEAQAATLSTVDADGRPDARILVIKDVQGEDFYFASGAESRKGRQLQHNDQAALTFYWPALGRQIRLRGTAIDLGGQAGAEDFLRRPSEARAVALTGRQSRPLNDPEELDRVLQEQRERIRIDPELAAPDWRLYAVRIEEAEFWQADSGLRHTRVQYKRDPGGEWEHGLLWP